MGTWGAGPFENDAGADFGGDLDDLAEKDRPAAIRAALRAALVGAEYLEGPDGDVAVAAAAIVAAQCPGGLPTNPNYGPKETIPSLPIDLRALAIQALDRVVGEDSELAELWEGGGGGEWRERILHLREILSSSSA